MRGSATYYAITATGRDFYPLAVIDDNRASAEQRARAIIGDIRTETGTDIYRETEHKNLRIVPKSKLRTYGITDEMIDAAFETL